jgi:hypothetical protein
MEGELDLAERLQVRADDVGAQGVQLREPFLDPFPIFEFASASTDALS